MERDKICKYCRYFLQHYIKGNLCYRKVGCGHCANVSFKGKRTYSPLNSCPLWEDGAIQKAERKEAIHKVLRNMSKQLHEIKLLLADSEKDEV